MNRSNLRRLLLPILIAGYSQPSYGYLPEAGANVQACEQWRPTPLCVQGIRAVRIGDTAASTSYFQKCANDGDVFGRYGIILAIHQLGNEVSYRERAEALLTEPAFRTCEPCLAMVHRDLALSYFTVAPRNRQRAAEHANAGCRLHLARRQILAEVGPCPFTDNWANPGSGIGCRDALGESWKPSIDTWDYAAWW